MKLVHSKTNFICDFDENQIPVIVIESPQIFTEYVSDLKQGMENGEGGFVMSENDKEIKLNKNAELIIDPWTIDFDSKKIKGKLFQYVKEISTENSYVEFLELKSAIFKYLEDVIEITPYCLEYETDFDENTIFKCTDLKINVEAESLLEKLIEYAKILASLCQINIIFFVNIKSFLSEDEMAELYKCLKYEKVTLILLENHMSFRKEVEKTIVIDKDKCIIDL